MTQLTFVQKSADEITKEIAKIGRSTAALSKQIQSAAIQVIGHAMKHGDVTLATRLVGTISSHNRAALVAFLEKFGPFAWAKQDKRFMYHKDSANNITFDDEYVSSLPSWESAKRPPEVRSMYDIDAEAAKFLDRMTKLAADPTVTVKERELLELLLNTRNKYVAKKYLGEAVNTPVLS